jgi:WhiB family transcriptional regulator, redox-sensing transcriptional regulator
MVQLRRDLAALLAASPEWEVAFQPPDWYGDALCAQTDPESFYPERGGSTREAKSTCLRCEVRDDCLAYALDNDERFGIWGGLSERERRKVKRDRQTPEEREKARAIRHRLRPDDLGAVS